MTNKTLITFLLDKSLSMRAGIESTIEAFNGYVDGLRDETLGEADIDMTLVQFDSEGLEKTWFEKPIAEVEKLDRTNYVPRGNTPLIESATKVIQALEDSVAKKPAGTKVIVCIQTDGEENCSYLEYTWEGLKDLIAKKKEAGWEFIFMGAGIDAYQQGSRMGIGAAQTVSYDRFDEVKTSGAFRATAMNSRMYASGMATSTAYTTEQKLAAGDVYDQTVPQTHAPLSGVKVTTSLFDLTSAGAAQKQEKKDAPFTL